MIRIISIAIFLIGLQFGLVFGQLSTFDNSSPTITQDIKAVIKTDNIDNPIREGARFVVESPDGNNTIGILNPQITSFGDAQSKTLALVKNIINILLGFTSLVVLVYLIYEGFLVLTAGTDEGQYKKALGKLKNAAIAIAGIAVSWLIVTFIFQVINTII